MTHRTASIAALLLVLLVCASCGGGQPAGLRGQKKSTIVLYRTNADVCRTITTPYAKVSKNQGSNRARWKIDDEFDCLDGTKTVRIEFPSGSPLTVCNLETTTTNLDCDVSQVPANTKGKYKVFFGGAETEDPELEIVQ